MFADYELQAHRLVEEGRPVTAESLGEIYFNLLKAYHGDALDYDEVSRVTWARIPHFYSTPYYVYQYATCFASSAQLMKQLTSGSDADRAAAIDRYEEQPVAGAHQARVVLEGEVVNGHDRRAPVRGWNDVVEVSQRGLELP